MESLDITYATATGFTPFAWQRRLALDDDMARLVCVPTGAGKTEGAVLGWLWRRRFGARDERRRWPRRLVYVLPMRVLVEQTEARIRAMLARLGLADEVPVHVLMGGVLSRDWVDAPEADQVLVGTLDQLFSRALMRGYGESRFRWPIDFGLLHTDSLWVLDEVQLFGEALVTSTQLQGLRAGTPSAARTLWMSATVDPRWLTSVDHRDAHKPLALGDADRRGELATRLAAPKVVRRIPVLDSVTIRASHVPGTLTLVVVNTVKTARGLHDRLNRQLAREDSPPELILLHSRFRPPDRAALARRLSESLSAEGRIVVATQVVEAGVDISARTLLIEVAPWASVVQRLGRSNRRGEYETADVLWAMPERPAPYELEGLEAAGALLDELEGRSLSPDALEALDAPLAAPSRSHVLRRRDLLGLFDTAPDLSGLDLDISRFVRDMDELTVGVAWRALDGGAPADDTAAPGRDELCPAAIGELRGVLKDGRYRAFHYDQLVGEWSRVAQESVRPGMNLIVDTSFGCYSQAGGFDPRQAGDVSPVGALLGASESFAGDPLSQRRGVWLSLAAHTDGVCEELEVVMAGASDLSDGERDALRLAARLHDWGKVHHVFQDAMRSGDEKPPDGLAGTPLAKRVGRGERYSRRGFRHELASLLAYLASEEAPDPLVAYLIAAHHGRVRLGARSVPGENAQSILGCRAGDVLPAVDVAADWASPEVVLDLSPLELGREIGATYTDLALTALADFGPFRLAYLEAILRVADRRRSAAEAREDADA